MANSKMVRKLAIHAQASTFANHAGSIRDVHVPISQTEKLEVEGRHVNS